MRKWNHHLKGERVKQRVDEYENKNKKWGNKEF